jgi:chemotaxis protein methyltransferase CheR
MSQVSERKLDGLSDRDFDFIRGLLHTESGIVLQETKRAMLVSRLSKRIARLGCEDFGRYRAILESVDRGPGEVV